MLRGQFVCSDCYHERKAPLRDLHHSQGSSVSEVLAAAEVDRAATDVVDVDTISGVIDTREARARQAMPVLSDVNEGVMTVEQAAAHELQQRERRLALMAARIAVGVIGSRHGMRANPSIVASEALDIAERILIEIEQRRGRRRGV